MNRIGLDFNAVGNHEFDAGQQELLRKQAGGCAQFTERKPCQIEQFPGAKFRFLAANVFTPSGQTLFPATRIERFGAGKSQVTVGFIGLTLKGTPDLVAKAGIGCLTFGDEADAINRAAVRLKEEGAAAIVVLIHQGGKQGAAGDPNGCNTLSGDILPILARLDPRVDVVVSGHTHQAYICDNAARDPARPFLLTSAGVYGEMVTDISLTIDPRTKRVIARQAHYVIVQSAPYAAGGIEIANTPLYPAFAPRPDIAAYVGTYVEAARALAQRVVGHLSGLAAKPGALNADIGGPLGNLIADAQLAATRGVGAQIAFTNPFGIRAPLQPAAGGAVTYGDIFKAQPFNNGLVTQPMTGAQIKAALEQGLDGRRPLQFLAPSVGFTYRYDLSRPAGERIVAMTLNGQPIDPAANYRVTTNSFLAGGGDGFAAFAAPRQATDGISDIAAVERWIAAVPVRQVPQEERVLDGGAKAGPR